MSRPRVRGGVILSLNPAVDVEWRLDRVLPEEKNEISRETRWPGGKGINVARWLGWLGFPCRVFLPLGGDTGRELARGLRTEKIRFVGWPMSGANRCNVVVSPSSGPQFRFNATWPRLSRSDATRLRQAASLWATRADPVVISGTLAFGAPDGTYADIVRTATRAGRRVFLDCDRRPFALAARQRPFLVKPNEFELGQWAGRVLHGEREVIQAATALSRETRGWVLVSRGALGGLLIHEGQGIALRAVAPKVQVRNTVGAGDALLAAVVESSSASEQPAEWLASGIAAGTLATQVPPGRLPDKGLWPKMKARIRVQPVRA